MILNNKINSDTLYLIIGIIIILVLVILFIVSYVLNKRTPVPKGCENLLIDEEKCSSCNNELCKLKKNINNITENKEED